jgi:AIR synthase-related protein
MTYLQDLMTSLRQSRGFAHKRDIAAVSAALSRGLPENWRGAGQATAVGDDCAALPDGDGYLLLAIEGFVEDFIQRMPWFAGYCGVMVNVSDIYAMGGRPLAVVDALWSRGMDPADEVLQGMAAAAQAYGTPIVGGHSNTRSERGQLAVAILGRARRLISSFTARPGDQLIMAIDLRGAYEEPFSYWNASTPAPGERLRGDLEILPQLAELGLCDAGKDISMAGAIGTALMLLECSCKGATIDLEAIPRPAGVALDRWLTSFPSFGFVLSVRPHSVQQVLQRFRQRGIDAAACGTVHAEPSVSLSFGGATEAFWHLDEEPFMLAQDAASVQEPV